MKPGAIEPPPAAVTPIHTKGHAMFVSGLKCQGEFTFVHRRNGERMKMWNLNRAGTWLMKRVGHWTTRLTRGVPLFGHWDTELHITNLVTNAGLAVVAARLVGATVDPADTLAVGTGTTAAAAGDTALETEITDSGLARATDAAPTFETTSVTNDTAVVNYLWTASGAKAITEAGVLTQDSGGDLLSRQVFASVGVVSGDTFEATWKFQVTTS